MTGYRGFESKKAYEDHYRDPANYADEIPAMREYAKEAATKCPKIGAAQWTCKPGECVCHLAEKVNAQR